MDVNSSGDLGASQGQQERSGHGHDTHAMPPQGVCDVYKKYQKMSDADVNNDLDVIDFTRGLTPQQLERLQPVNQVSAEAIEAAAKEFLGMDKEQDYPYAHIRPCTVYTHVDFPGLKLFPSLLPPEVQVALVDRLLHRDLSFPEHKINLHDDYNVPYPPLNSSESSSRKSFFSLPQSSPAYTLTPRNPLSNHNPLNMAQFLRKRWRWLTLGSQYDWATRQYPPKDKVPTQFPPDIAKLVSNLFPPVRAESGVVLIYSPKDFMPVHRDVSELCERELCSFTLGCDGLFIIALDKDQDQCGNDDEERPQKTVVIRVRSGDMVQMAGPTRWSWHAMPKVMAGTCAEFLQNWPAVPQADLKDKDMKAYQKWKGYMTGKRINISCRQVYD